MGLQAEWGKDMALVSGMVETVHGIPVFRGFLDADEQRSLLSDLRDIARAAPPFSPITGWGKPMSVRITAAGRFCWYSDRRGYRYIEAHPATGQAFPPIPALALRAWHEFETRADPDCCLINHYREGARMGLHQDRDEADFSFPVVSISLGDPALFRIGGLERGDPTRSLWLYSGDVMVLSGENRLRFHGIDRIKAGESALLKDGGRLNLTLRRVGEM